MAEKEAPKTLPVGHGDQLSKVVVVGGPIRVCPGTEFISERYSFAILPGGTLRIEAKVYISAASPAGTIWYLPPGCWAANGQNAALAAANASKKSAA